ncbi:hypothetical protein FRC11_009235 [Ceratobasidium sp. 423]|nr:hypothetical protein FRC11_009235 [Ceratobasidium sp. 423]
MFMRYLTRLVDQIIAAVSAEQAQNFNWEAHAGEFNQEADKQSTDGLSLFDAQNLDQIPDKFHPSAGPGFTIPVKPEYFPNGIENTEARLVPGEDNTALLVVSRNIEERKFEDTLSAEELRKMIDDCSLQLGQVSAEDVAVLAAHGLREKYSDAFETYDQRLKLLQSDRIALGMFEERRVEDILKQDKGAIIAEVHGIIKTIDSKTYPSLSWGENPPKSEITVQMRQKYPLLDEISKNLGHAYRPDLVKDEEFQTLKSRCLFVQAYFSRNPRLSVAQRIGCVDYIFNRIPYSVPGPPTAVAGPGESDGRARPSSVHWIIGTDPFSSLAPGEGNRHPTPKDPDFIGGIALLESAHPELSGIAQRIQLCLRRFLTNLKEDITADEVARILKSEWERLTREARNEQEHQFQAGQQQALDALLRYLRQAMYLASTITKHRRRLDSITELPREPYSDGTARFHCVGWLSFPGSAWDNYSIYPLELSQPEQADQIQLCKTKLKFDFNLEHGQSIEFMQLVNDKCLVVISGQQWIQIHVGDGARLKRTIRNAQPKVKLNCDAPGQQYMFAFDQVTRLMAMIHGHKDGRKLSIYSFDERFANVRSRGSPMLLKNWYSEPTELHGICFVSGLEEICLIETSGRFRIISLVTQQFRTASLRVSPPIIDAFSAPGGPYLLLALGGGEKSNQHQLVAFHRTTFETHEGAINSFALFSCSGPRVATSFKREGFVHVVSFSMATKAITSTILQITPKTSKPLLHSERKHSRGIRVETVNNCLIDCHSEVWTQFPVVSVVTRNTPTAIDRQPRQLIFVSPTTIDGVGGYFARMISTFQTATQKPIGESSSATKVRSINSAEISEYISNQISEFKTGSFIVEFLCLIPLHLAVARENRFIPLKDGVWNPDYERSLLGEDVPAMIDVLSLGWYESIFQSYMAKKTVRVVSSMGNSYFLNHFADTSFIGSAMCDNEGVWLTCTPVDKYLLVLLNFEGNYSTESGGQKDAPLVLFNTAISNLVLFQSDFAVSRDATGLFTIFQSPTTVLDPNVNRGLFNSTLTIVIKDVPNADSKDIVREFSLKFQAIVDQERGQNFVTRLHRGRIQIVPWPVVNSPAFYNLYDRLHQRLDQEPFTHGSGGAFLRSLKALMAMVNTTDGGSLDQHLAAHRAQQIMERLPSALCYGRDAEGLLKNMDADEDLQSPNHKHSFFVPEFAGENATENKALVERALQSLVQMCHPTLQTRYQIPDASYIEALQNRLYEMLDERLSLVRRWMSVNMERFPSGNQKMRNLTGKLSSAELSMRNAVKLCSYECSDCFLLCLRPSQHSGDHGCGTDHGCVSSCEITEEHLQREGCGLPYVA